VQAADFRCAVFQWGHWDTGDKAINIGARAVPIGADQVGTLGTKTEALQMTATIAPSTC